MAKQPQIRPWSRLTSLRPVPAPESHPPLIPSTFKTNSTPQSQSSYQTQNVAAPFPTSLKSTQEKNTSSLDNNVNVNANASKSLPATTISQKPKLITPPPSSKLNVSNEIDPKVEEEKKTMLVNKITEKPNGNGSLEKGHHHNKVSNSEDTKVRIITISGENKGAYMEIIQSRKQPNSHHKMGNSKTKTNDNESENANKKDNNHKVKTDSSLPRNGVYINSNVQCINNSLLLHTSCTSNDPGVHLTLSKKLHLKEHVDGKHN